jgi:thiamine monophosphate synthase
MQEHSWALRQTGRPVFAWGGIARLRWKQLRSTGIDRVLLGEEVFGEADPGACVRQALGFWEK